MPEGDFVSLEKSADILQATFKHYYEMAMDHLTKASTTSNILLIIVGAIITLVGFDQKVCGVVDLGGAIGVIVIALFGAAWTWKQFERYCHWEYIAYEYQKELTKMVPMLKTGRNYYDGAQKAAAKEFGDFFAKKIEVRYLWVFLHGIIAVIGVGLLAISIQNRICP
jgi:hypothetical protein